MKKGLFIVFEGLDGAGKTTIIKSLIKNPKTENKERIFYHKGFLPDNSLISRLKKHNFTIVFLLGLIYLSIFVIKQKIKEGKIFVRDRYIWSIETYLPANKRTFSKALIKLAKIFLLKPDLLVYVTVSNRERISRLKKFPKNPYHQELIKNPGLIRTRNAYYDKLFKEFSGKKLLIDTTNSNQRKLRNQVKIINKTLKTLFFSKA